MHHPANQPDNHTVRSYIKIAINILSLSSRIEYALSVPLKRFSLSLPQFNALRIIAFEYPNAIVLNKLTEKMIDKSSNTSRLVDKLVLKKLASRQTSAKDRRIIHILITELGLSLITEVSEILERNLEKQFYLNEPTDSEELMSCLKGLREAS